MLIGANDETAKAKAQRIIADLTDLVAWRCGAAYWGMKSEESRVIAEAMHDSRARAMMHRIADHYAWMERWARDQQRSDR